MKRFFVLLILSGFLPQLPPAFSAATLAQGESPAEAESDFGGDSHAQETFLATTPAPRTAIIAELVGLSTLKGFALLTFPFLMPIFLLALAILILPLPILSTPIAFGRRLGADGGSGNEVDEILAEILQSTNCMERFSCEIGRSIKTPQVRTIIDESFAELGSQLEGKWKNSYYGYILGSNHKASPNNFCVKFKCKISKNPL